MSLDSSLPGAWGCLDVIAFEQGRVAEAETQFHQSILDGRREGHYADLAALYIQMGRYDEAAQVLGRGLAIKSDDATLHLEFGNLYLQTGKLREAIAQFRQAAALDPRYPDAVRALAIALMEDGKMIEAESALRIALRTFDESQRWRLHLTLCQLLIRLADETGNPELAQEAWAEVSLALRAAIKHPDPHFYAGIVQFKLEDYRGSLRCFRQCQKLDPSRVDAEINARRVSALIRQEKIRSKTTIASSVVIGVVVISQLSLLWWGALKHVPVVTSTMITVLVPICLGLMIVAVLLPSLTKLKLTGLEAELSQPKPTDALASGPKGDVNFGAASLNVSGALSAHMAARAIAI